MIGSYESVIRIGGTRLSHRRGGLGGPREVMELPVSHTEHPEEKLWERFEAYWLRLALEGVPADFGKKEAPQL